MQKFQTIFLSIFLLFCQAQCHEIIYNGSDIYLVPKGVPHTETLIYLHGVGGSASNMLSTLFSNEATMFARDTTRIVLLTAPLQNVTAYGGKLMHSWFNIITFNVKKEIDIVNALNLSEFVKTSVKIHQVMKEEIDRLGGDSTKLFIGGFSQGCFMSLYSGLTFDKTIGGIMGSSGALVTIPQLGQFCGANANIPLYISHGMNDTVVNFELAEGVYRERLSPLQHKITKVYENNVGHQITATMQAKERQWFFDQTRPKNEVENLFLPVLN